jgi:hypothetical protein
MVTESLGHQPSGAGHHALLSIHQHAPCHVHRTVRPDSQSAVYVVLRNSPMSTLLPS